MKKENNIFIYLGLSIIAAFLLLIITFLSTESSIELKDKSIVGLIFIISCAFGLSFALRPGWYRKNFRHGNIELKKGKIKKYNIDFIGHHPKCIEFRNHIIKTKKKSYCAGCLGLAFGTLVSIFLMFIYIFGINKLPSFINFFLPIGFIIIIIVYFEIITSIRKPIIHVIVNFFFVISFLLIVISILEITGSIFYGSIAVLLSYLWLDTRCQLSNRQHKCICNSCNKSCKIY